MADQENDKKGKAPYRLIIGVIILAVAILVIASVTGLNNQQSASSSTTAATTTLVYPPTNVNASSVSYFITNSEAATMVGPVSPYAYELTTPAQLNESESQALQQYGLTAEYYVAFQNTTSYTDQLTQSVFAAQNSSAFYSSLLNSSLEISNTSSFIEQATQFISPNNVNVSFTNATNGLNATVGGMTYSFGRWTTSQANLSSTETVLLGVKNGFVVMAQLSQPNVVEGYNVTSLASIVASHLG